MLHKLQGQGGKLLQIEAECIAVVEALNHDDTVRAEMRLYQTSSSYVCQRIDRPCTIDVRYKLETVDDEIGIYQFFGTEPLANYLYGCAGITVPGLRNVTYKL